jgi:hypothetical protein
MSDASIRLVYLGGNGHATARLDGARAAIVASGAPIEIADVPYPGFEDRPRAPSFEAFLDAISGLIGERIAAAGRPLVYASGIGGLLALCLRARGDHLDLPMLLQAPVLWGLERRWMPRLMRLLPAERLLRAAFASPRYQARFAAKQFMTPPSAEVRAAFFDGYARCSALPDFFAWFGPRLLRDLEARLAARPEALGRIAVWWGAHDHVVSTKELAWTETALGVRWPLRVFDTWGHYPMIDAPAEWVNGISEGLAAAESFPGPGSPQAP